MDGLRHQLHGAFKSTAEMVMPVLSRSAFKEKGVRGLPDSTVSPCRFRVACWGPGPALLAKAEETARRVR